METLLKRKYNPASNLKKELEALWSAKPNQEAKDFSASIFAVHGSTWDRVANILKERKIYSYRSLVDASSPYVSDSRTLATDKLDIAIWADNYVFMNVWRVHPWDIQEAYVCFGNSIISRTWNVISMKEITHYWWIVSDESARVFTEANPTIDVPRRNKEAIRQYFEHIIDSKDFTKLFGRFLARYYPSNPKMFLTDLLYPADEARCMTIEGNKCLINPYEWPQLMLPKEVELDNLFRSVLIITNSKSKIDAILSQSPDKDKVKLLSDYQAWYEEMLGLKMTQTNKYVFINMALFEIASRDITNNPIK